MATYGVLRKKRPRRALKSYLGKLLTLMSLLGGLGTHVVQHHPFHSGHSLTPHPRDNIHNSTIDSHIF